MLVNTHPSDEVPDWVPIDDILDGWLDVHLEDFQRDGTLVV